MPPSFEFEDSNASIAKNKDMEGKYILSIMVSDSGPVQSKAAAAHGNMRTVTALRKLGLQTPIGSNTQQLGRPPDSTIAEAAQDD